MLITADQLCRHLDLSPEKHSDQISKLGALASEVTELWEEVTGRLWVRRVGHVEIIHPQTHRIRTIFLNLWPIETVTTVEEKHDAEDWELLESDQYQLMLPHMLMRFNAHWLHDVRVTYTGGYTEQTTPSDVRRALFVQAEFMLKRFSGEKLILRSQGFEGGNTNYETADLHPFFASLAKRKRRIA